MIIVPSIAPRTAAEAKRLLRALAGHSALAELRLDGVRVPVIANFLEGKRPPVIVTYRSRAEGGRFTGSVRTVVSRLKAAIAAGAEFIDVEERLGLRAIGELAAFAGKSRMILSRHDVNRTPRDATRILRRMISHRPAIVKFAAKANSFRDTITTTTLLKLAARSRQNAVVIAMGEYGTHTRILQGILGGALSFAANPPARPTAPGQLAMKEMEELYRAGSINSRTRIYGLVGNPVSSSMGIHFHNAVFDRSKYNAVYLNFLVDEIGDFMSSMGSRCAGLSVTMPFKRAIIPYLDRLDSSAVDTGAVNTMVRRSGASVGLNTDYLAFRSLLRNVISLRGKNLLLIGTGGAARSVAATAALTGAKLLVAGRDRKKAGQLAKEFGGSWIHLSEIADSSPDILVNATPVGMTAPDGPGTPGRIFPVSALRRSMVVCDFANPRDARTLLVSEARALRCRVIAGERIFQAQAALQSGYFIRAGRLR